MNFIWREPFWEFRSFAQLPPYIMGILICNLTYLMKKSGNFYLKTWNEAIRIHLLVRPFLMPIFSLRNIKFFGRVKPKGGHSPQNHIFLGSPLWEWPPSMGYKHHKTQGKDHHEPRYMKIKRLKRGNLLMSTPHAYK